MANNNVLYTWPYSICSTMVRYTFANRGVPKDTKDEMSIEERQINIMTGEQLSEHYLCEVNANGEVFCAMMLVRGTISDSNRSRSLSHQTRNPFLKALKSPNILRSRIHH
jgi:hypothetical protein